MELALGGMSSSERSVLGQTEKKRSTVRESSVAGKEPADGPGGLAQNLRINLNSSKISRLGRHVKRLRQKISAAINSELTEVYGEQFMEYKDSSVIIDTKSHCDKTLPRCLSSSFDAEMTDPRDPKIRREILQPPAQRENRIAPISCRGIAEIVIRHHGELYRLSLTRNGKLILRK